MEEEKHFESLQGTRWSIAQFSLQTIVYIQSLDSIREDRQIAQIRDLES